MAAPAVESRRSPQAPGPDDTDNADPLAPKEAPRKKTRYTARQTDVALAKANDKRSQGASSSRGPSGGCDQPTRQPTEKTQAAPLGLNGDTAKKQKKPKRQKGDAKERLQEQPKPADTSTPVAPTVNPALGGSAVRPLADPLPRRRRLPTPPHCLQPLRHFPETHRQPAVHRTPAAVAESASQQTRRPRPSVCVSR